MKTLRIGTVFLLALLAGCSRPADQKSGSVPSNYTVVQASPRNRALLVGINAYSGAPLAGCVNDVEDDAAYLQKVRGFKAWEIMLLTDEAATAANIRLGLKWVADDYRTGDLRFFAYSGHGAQMPGAKEGDGKFEVICPVDFDWSTERAITDRDFVVAFGKLPKGAIFDWISDSCHAGGLADDTKAVGGKVVGRSYPVPAAVAKRLEAEKATTRPLKHVDLNVGYIAGCRSNQTSADAFIDGRPCGAMHYYWHRRLKTNPEATAEEMARYLRGDLHTGGYTQLPQADGARSKRPFLK